MRPRPLAVIPPSLAREEYLVTDSEASIHAKAIDLVRLSLEMTAEAGSGHPTSAASLAHLVTVLMYERMRYDPQRPADPAADRLVLSEGHACPIVYAAAADLGMAVGRGERRRMTREDALRLREIASEIDGHPNPAEGFPFFPAATGSLGQGLSIAAGLALAAKLDGIDRRAFCLIGDGESREGQIWEAVDFIVDYDLRGACPIFNCNAYGQTGKVSPRQSPESLEARLRASGMDALAIDGHSPVAIRQALAEHADRAGDPASRPVAIVARTVKGWGCPSLQEKNLHGKPVKGRDKQRALEELQRTARSIGADGRGNDLAPSPPPACSIDSPADVGVVPGLTESLRRQGHEDWTKKDGLATRKAYGIALRALGRCDPRIVALDGDVGNSTYAELFAEDPELGRRYVECRIAEQNMASCAVGLWAGGRLPFVSSFGKFLTRAYDQIEMAIVSRANIKMIGSHAGVSLAADGPSQMALPDVAFFRAFSGVRNSYGKPMCYVLQPADAYAAYALTVAMSRHDGPCYMRTLRPDLPFLYNDDTEFALGGHQVVREGEDLLLLATGFMVHEARKALEDFEARGVHPTLVDLYSLPFDEAALIDLMLRNHRRVLTVEDNYGAGIGSAMADVVGRAGAPVRIEQMHVRRLPKSGRSPDDVLAYLSLDADEIVRTGMGLVEQGAS
jgi:transketolase